MSQAVSPSGSDGDGGSHAGAGRGTQRLPPTRVVVLGGGAAGLTAAWDLARPGFDVTLVEAGEETGGNVRAHEVAGLLVDVGAESFATRGGAVADLAVELGMRDEIVSPNPAGAWLHSGGRSVPMPHGGMLGIPSSPLARDVVAVIGRRAAWRAYLDRLVPVMKIGREENLARLVERRMGRAVLDLLVAPIVTGVYSTAVEDVDIEAILPGLNGALTRAGSLSGAVAELRLAASRAAAGAGSKPGSAVLGLRGGMHRLTERLTEALRERGGKVLLSTRARALRPGENEQDAPWQVECADGATLPADAVVVATPGAQALEILHGISEATEALIGLDWPVPTPVDIVTVVLDEPALDSAPRGTGLLVAEGTGAKGATHATAKWAWLAESAGPHRHVVRLSYGRPGREEPRLSDDALFARAADDLAVLFGVPVSEGSIVGLDRAGWGMYPAHRRGQHARLDALTAALPDTGAIEVTGAWVAGTGLAAVIPAARQAARRIRGLRWKALTAALPDVKERP